MNTPLRFLIVDGYPAKRRAVLEAKGISLAWKLHADLLVRHLPGAAWDVLFPCDEDARIPCDNALAAYSGIIWTGSSLSITDRENPQVTGQIELAERMFEAGVPGWGSCWGMQVAAVAAGGKADSNPRGKEIGIARKIMQTPGAHGHPMFKGKSSVFECFTVHDDMVTELPEGGVLLASNDFTRVQALAVTHGKGIFWGTQYHLEYTLYEMARLIAAYEKTVIRTSLFTDHQDLAVYIHRMDALAREPGRKDLRWQLAMSGDMLTESIRQVEFSNWIHRLVLPGGGPS